jgi:hypothetical protein
MPSLNSYSNPYIDELPVTPHKAASFAGAKLGPNSSVGLSSHLNTVTEEHEHQSKTSYETDIDRATKDSLKSNPYLDEFSPYNPFIDHKDKKDEENRQRQKRQYKRIGSKRQIGIDGDDFETEELNGFFSFLDRLFQHLSQIVENTVKEFTNWNNWFKSKTAKKKPPTRRVSKPLYVREEFNVHRSPHLWKSNPNKPWVLTFGEPRVVNNKVSEILYKYQNATISKDA